LKIRVVPSILTNGVSQVKGEKFNNWRTVGTVEQAVRVQSRRDVDEIVLLDVTATKEKRLISCELIRLVATSLRIPLTVGGGIASINDVALLLEAGADKIVLGSAADGPLVSEIAKEFGSQAVVCSVDATGPGSDSVATNSGSRLLPISPAAFAKKLVGAGAGEILLQNVDRDGTMIGLDLDLLASVVSVVSVPVLASSGLSSPANGVEAARIGAAAVVAGAVLQFTQTTPLDIKKALGDAGYDVRR
jgi:cyclase